MSGPIVEVIRGGVVESAHCGSAAVVDDAGRPHFIWGDPERAVFPRSAVKAIQALPLVESGAADRFGFGAAELALACSSHSGEADHVSTARLMLARAGLDERALECGAHWSSRPEVARAQARSIDEPTPAYNNCSGKHSGFLALAVERGHDPRGYVGAEHPVQVEVRAALEDLLGVALSAVPCGLDGCSIPSYAVPLAALARGFARLGTGRDLAPARAAAAKRLFAACWEKPFMVAGTGRFCTDVMRLFPGRVFVKTGAEGVFCGSLPTLGLGIALKCDDGATRASEAMMALLLQRFAPLSAEERTALKPWARPELRNWRGLATGEIRPSTAFERALAGASPP